MASKLGLVLTGMTLVCLAIAWTRMHSDNHTELPVPVLRYQLLNLPPDTRVELVASRTVDELSEPIAQFETVFWEPADTETLRHLIRTTPLVKGKRILEIGCGTGLVSLCCLQAGAAAVVATDVNPSAIANTAYNAERLNFDQQLTTRWVPADNRGAFTVIGDTEIFDLIITNPPWENCRPGNVAEYALYDENFELLQTLLEGLNQHLTPDGKALLVYGFTDAIRRIQQLAGQYSLAIRVLDDRSLEDLPAEFLPGMILELTPMDRSREATP